MKAFIPFAALLTTALSAPTPEPTTTAAAASASGVSFPITDVVGTNLTIDEYARKLEEEEAAQGVAETTTLAKRQYSGDTYNQLTDGTPCRAVTVIYARGTTQEGNVGSPDSEGPTFFNALAAKLGGTGQLAIQGVTYSANIFGFLAGGDSEGADTTFNLVNTAVTQCPSTKIVLSGYSQGAQLVHTATQRLSADIAAKLSAVITFGDADRDEDFGSVDASKILIICHDNDLICENSIIITPEHRNYEIDADTAADFVVARV